MMPKQTELIQRLVELESDVRYQEYARPDESEYLYTAGTLPVLVSAPHGAVHTRHGKPKDEDEYTASLACLIGELTGAHVLYARRRSHTDPNADRAAPYKHDLLRIVQDNHIQFVLDLHGANSTRDFGLALGSMHGKSCSPEHKQAIVSTLGRYGISANGHQLSRLDIDHKFPGAGSPRRETIIRFCHRYAIPAVQVEVHADLRIAMRRPDATAPDKAYKGDPVLIANLIHALSAVVISLSRSLSTI